MEERRCTMATTAPLPTRGLFRTLYSIKVRIVERMARILSLRENLQSRRVLSALQRMGWTVSRITGSHVVLAKAGMAPLVLPLGHSTIRATTILAALRRAGEDVSRFATE